MMRDFRKFLATGADAGARVYPSGKVSNIFAYSKEIRNFCVSHDIFAAMRVPYFCRGILRKNIGASTPYYIYGLSFKVGKNGFQFFVCGDEAAAAFSEEFRGASCV